MSEERTSQTSNIHLIPKRIFCPECNDVIGNPRQLTVMGKLWCNRCKMWRTVSDVVKQFGVIKDVLINAPDNPSK